MRSQQDMTDQEALVITQHQLDLLNEQEIPADDPYRLVCVEVWCDLMRTITGLS